MVNCLVRDESLESLVRMLWKLHVIKISMNLVSCIFFEVRKGGFDNSHLSNFHEKMRCFPV